MHSYIWSLLDLNFKKNQKKNMLTSGYGQTINSDFVIQLYKMTCVKTQIKHPCKIFYLTSA